MEILAAAPQTVGGIAAHFQSTRPAVAKHLGRLERAGLVESSWHGREHRYRLVVEPLGEIVAWLEGLAGATPSRPSSHRPRRSGTRRPRRRERVPSDRGGAAPEVAAPAPSKPEPAGAGLPDAAAWQVW